MSMLRRDFLKTGSGLVVTFSMLGTNNLAGAQGGAAHSKSMVRDQVDAWLGIGADGRVTVYSGKVDLGTGVRTALAQLVAEELDVAFSQIDMVMGDTLTINVVPAGRARTRPLTCTHCLSVDPSAGV